MRDESVSAMCSAAIHPSSFIPHPSFHPLEYLIVIAVHPQPPVHLLCGGIAAVDVEADPFHGIGGLRETAYMVVQSAEHALLAHVGTDVNALDPPHDAVTPITPLRRDEE